MDGLIPGSVNELLAILARAQSERDVQESYLRVRQHLFDVILREIEVSEPEQAAGFAGETNTFEVGSVVDECR